MKNFQMNKVLKFVLVLLCSATLGGILGFIDNYMGRIDWFLICSGVFISILVFIILIDATNMIRVFKGEYSKAIQSYEKIIKKSGKIKIIANVIIYDISLCHYRRGEFHKVEAYLDKLDLTTCSDNIKWGYFSLQASTFMLLEENIHIAGEYLEKATQLFNPEECYPRLAYYEGIKGNQKEALNYIEGYENKKSKRRLIISFPKVFFLFDKFIYDIENNYFLGMAYLKINKTQLAKEYLQKASKGQYENYFSKRAEEILAELD